MPVVSNTSPLLNLALIGRLDLLPDQFGAVFIPPAVHAELRPESRSADAALVRRALADGWLKVAKVADTNLVRILQADLDPGESEAIALALQMGFGRVLMDEHEGRERAKALGLRPLGVIGILMRAKRDGGIPLVRPLLLTLQQVAGFWISEPLFSAVLKEMDEE